MTYAPLQSYWSSQDLEVEEASIYASIWTSTTSQTTLQLLENEAMSNTQAHRRTTQYRTLRKTISTEIWFECATTTASAVPLLEAYHDANDPNTWSQHHFDLADAAEEDLEEAFALLSESDFSSRDSATQSEYSASLCSNDTDEDDWPEIAEAFTFDDVQSLLAADQAMTDNQWGEKCRYRATSLAPWPKRQRLMPQSDEIDEDDYHGFPYVYNRNERPCDVRHPADTSEWDGRSNQQRWEAHLAREEVRRREFDDIFPNVPTHDVRPTMARIKEAVSKAWHYHPKYKTQSLTAKYMKLKRAEDETAHLLEVQFVYMWYMLKANNGFDRLMAIITHAKMLNMPMSKVALTIIALQSAWEYFMGPPGGAAPKGPKPQGLETQGLEPQGFEDMFTDFQDLLDKYDTIKASPFFEKIYKFASYSLALSLFAPLGIDLDLLKFDKIAQEAMRKKYHLGPDFIHTLLDTALFLTRRGYQCYQAGSIMPMFHSAEKYQQWYDQAELLQRQSHFLSNPEVHGIDRFKYLADLKHAIECGRSMKKCATKKDDKFLIAKLLASLELTHDLEVTKRAAQRDRKTPLCLLLYGGSGIGKSTVQNILFQHYGKVRGLSTESEYRYIRNPTEEFWSGMNSTQWCVVLDDIAFLSARLGVLDPSLAEMLCIANNVPFVPAQAELSDKGRTPVRAELVLGSTNTEDLNLHAYFSCPLAVQRRFPWVIDIKVKREYQDDARKGMLDSTKVPVTPAGEYPDLWNFVIKRVEPVGDDRAHQMGRTVVDREILSMAEFLRWYNKVIDDHNTVQDKILASNARTYDTVLCDACRLPTTWCECLVTQSREYDLFGESEREPMYIRACTITSKREDMDAALAATSWRDRCAFYWHYAVYTFICSTWVNQPLSWWLGDHWHARYVLNSPHKIALSKVALRYAGARASRRFNADSTTLLVASTAIASTFALYKVHGHRLRALMTQGAVLGKAPVRDEVQVERPSFIDPFPFQRDHLSQQTLCSKGTDGKILKDNVRYAMCTLITTDGVKKRTTLGVNVRGSVFMCNAHSIPSTVPFNLDIIADKTGSGVCRVMKNILISKSMVKTVAGCDLAFIHVRALPPGTNLVPWMAKPAFVGKLDGMYIGRGEDGALWEKDVSNIQPARSTWRVHDTEVTSDMWRGRVIEPTVYGNCGAMLVASTGCGWTLLGIHTLGDGASEVQAMRVDPTIVQQVCEYFEPIAVARGDLHISAPSAPRELGKLVPQSVVTKVGGSANVIGSFVGQFRRRNYSSVTPTVIAPFLQERLGFQQTRTIPEMGRAPWQLALKDMVRPVVRLDNDVLHAAKQMYVAETRHEDLSRVHVYDMRTAINGCAGVAFCDKLPRNTSAGAPYKCPKARFLRFYEDGTTDVDVVPEIKSTIADIIATYHRGERYHAVFCGQLKDEPVTFAKAAAGKTRLFTMAGLAHTIVTRQYLLAVVVHLENNRYKYELAVGISAQSKEWHEAYAYLTQFGTETLVAGDYGKFDKRMPANVILAAFDVILEICASAGYTEQDLAVVRGIAYDTAFPTVDFDGELVEFFGCNPSGHALTVIINSLVNSLYMRYAFITLRPPGVEEPFKRCVALLTYGDDNAMGVSASASWFNHTAIQAVLADVDIEYTMAEKDAASIPYISIKDVSFLKRTWRWEEELGVFVGPLAQESMEKMLMVCVQKANISMNCQAIQTIGTATREFFFFGRETFEEMSAALKAVVKDASLELNVEPSTFPSWEALCKDFHARSLHVKELSFK